MPTAHGYIRCSHKRSEESGLGLEAQEEAIQRYCQRERQPGGRLEGVEMGEIYCDKTQSAFKKAFLQRPEARHLNYAVHPGDHILFARLDRGFRSLTDCMHMVDLWMSRDITPHFIDFDFDFQSPMGRAFLQIRAIFAEMDSRLKSAVIREALDRKRARDERISRRPPQGTRFVRRNGKMRIEDDPESRAIIDKIVRLHDGGMSLNQIVRTLETYDAERNCRQPNYERPRWPRSTVYDKYCYGKNLQQLEPYGLDVKAGGDALTIREAAIMAAGLRGKP